MRRVVIRRNLAVWAVAGLAAWSGCGGPRLQVEPTDPRYEYELGRREYDRSHWLEAQTHLKRFIDLNPGHAVADSAQLLLGMAKFNARSYAEAAVEFAILVREFPRSPLRDDASYHECLSYFEQMRPPELDPTYAHRAATCFREFLIRYPNTTLRDEAEQRLVDIDDLLAEKDVRIGVMFAKMNRPDAAKVYLQGVLTTYPHSRMVPKALYWLGRSYERENDQAAAVDAYQRLIDSFPDATWTPEARRRLRRILGHHPELGSTSTENTSPP